MILTCFVSLECQVVRWMEEMASSEDWDTCEVQDDPLLDATTRLLLAALLTHTNISQNYLGWVN